MFQALSQLLPAFAVCRRNVWDDGQTPLADQDSEVMAILKREKDRQTRGLELIASGVRPLTCLSPLIQSFYETAI